MIIDVYQMPSSHPWHLDFERLVEVTSIIIIIDFLSPTLVCSKIEVEGGGKCKILNMNIWSLPHPFWSQEARKNIKKRVSSTNSTHPMLRLSLQLLLVAEIDQFKVYKMYFFISRFWRKPQGITLCFPCANLQISKGPNDFKLSYLSDQEELERQPQHRMRRICAGNAFSDAFVLLLAP